MTSTVTTPSRPLAAAGPRRSGPVLLSLKGPRRRRTSCSALASPEKQSTAAELPQPTTNKRSEDQRTDYNEVAAALESIYKLSPAVVEGEEEEEKKKKTRKRKGSRVVSAGKEHGDREEPAEAEDGPGEEGGDEGEQGGGGGRQGGGGGARVRGDAAEGARRVHGHGRPRLEAHEDPAGAQLRAERAALQDHAANAGHLWSAGDLAGRAAEGADRRGAGGGQRRDRAAAAAPPRRRPSSQEQAHQAQPPAGSVRHQQVLPGHGQRREVRRPLPGRRQRPHHRRRPVRAQARLPHLHLRALLDQALRGPRHDDALQQLHALPLRHGVGEAGGQQGQGGAGVRPRAGAHGRGGDAAGGHLPGEVPRRAEDDEADLLPALAEPRHAGGAHQRDHRGRRHRGRRRQAHHAAPPRHRRSPGLSEAQGKLGDQAAVRAGREREAHAERDRRQPQHLEGDGPQVRAQGAHEAQAPHTSGVPAQIHVIPAAHQPPYACVSVCVYNCIYTCGVACGILPPHSALQASTSTTSTESIVCTTHKEIMLLEEQEHVHVQEWCVHRHAYE